MRRDTYRHGLESTHCQASQTYPFQWYWPGVIGQQSGAIKDGRHNLAHKHGAVYVQLPSVCLLCALCQLQSHSTVRPLHTHPDSNAPHQWLGQFAPVVLHVASVAQHLPGPHPATTGGVEAAKVCQLWIRQLQYGRLAGARHIHDQAHTIAMRVPGTLAIAEPVSVLATLLSVWEARGTLTPCSSTF